MVRASSHEGGTPLERMPQPRLLRPGENVCVFEGLTPRQPGPGEQAGFYREDLLVLPLLGAIALKVNWHNRYKRIASKDMIDPLNAATQGFERLKSDQTFTAELDITPEMFELAWLRDERRFTQSPASMKRGETPRTEHRKLLVLELYTQVKLVVTTPIGDYRASAASNSATPVTYSQFLPYRWQFFDEQLPQSKRLYAPDSIDPDVLAARFVLNDSGFKPDLDIPLAGEPVRPLVGV